MPRIIRFIEVKHLIHSCICRVYFINNLFALTTQENDYATQSMLKWFVDEQVEEEDNAQNIIDNLRMIKDNGYGLYMLDKELGARVYTQAAPLAGK